jgi:hypothetical protein
VRALQCTGVEQHILYYAVTPATADRTEEVWSEEADRAIWKPGVCPEACGGAIAHLNRDRGLNMAATACSGLDGSCAQAASGRVRRNHSQRRRNAKPSNWRSGSPSPPCSLGEHTMAQATLQRPPVESVPAHRNALRLLSICLIAHAERLQQIDTWIEMAERIVWVRVALAAFVRRPPFQVGIRAATASTRCCSSARLSLDKESGAPRYFVGNSWILQGNTCCTTWMSSWNNR